ncbi:hypothetical protein EGT07_25805 [Herbaspirillum sp. HC18]|nr:hypothetical protein EGT07_25805 [Herbaspirillum sp. HC18]
MNIPCFAWCRRLLLTLGLSILTIGSAQAVPAFASQTGQPCANCHITGFTELTSFGRQFKLRGYALGEAKMPVSGGALISRTSTRNANVPGDDMAFADDSNVIIQRLSLYLAGRVAEGTGGFVNWNYDSAEKRGMMEMIDLRTTTSTSLGGKELLLGLTLNNNPTVSDIYNSTPGFGFPHTAPSPMNTANPNAQVQLNNGLAYKVAGASVFGWWDNTLYGEIGAYRTADGALSLMRAGIADDEKAAIQSGAPYWRFAAERQWDSHSLMAGTYGLIVQRFPNGDRTGGLADRFRDIAFDAQYQYLTDEHRVTSGITWIRENQQWRASFDPTGVAGMRDAPESTLKTTKAHLTYFFRKMYGASLGLIDIRGDTDRLQYDTMMPVTGSVLGSPNTRAFQYEISYLPIQHLRLGMQYTAYQKFNGAKSNYDGFGRNARDNNTLYLWAWLLY